MSKKPDHYANEKGGQFKELKLKDEQQEEFYKVPLLVQRKNLLRRVRAEIRKPQQNFKERGKVQRMALPYLSCLRTSETKCYGGVERVPELTG